MRTSLFVCAALAFLCGCRSSTSDTEPHLQSGMLQYYYLDRLEKNLQNCRERINKAKSREDALKLVAEAGKKVAYAFKNVPLRQRVESTITGVEHFDGYKAQKLLIRTRENFTMTATLFLPDNGQKIFPAVIFLAGHAKNGRLGYRRPPVNLVKRGIAVLNADPIHQGERMQFSQYSLVDGHNILNRQLLAVGEDLAQWRLHDAVRLVDYLETRSDIDSSRIGVHGNSGGGTMSAFLAAFDRRIAAAAPSCYITTFYHNVLNELPADGEQMPADFLAQNGEMIDLILAHAPKPYRILCQKYDFFDKRGALETFSMAKKIYTLLGAPDNISLVMDSKGHELSKALRESANEFFCKTFGIKSSPAEIKHPLPPGKKLLSTPTGQVLDLPREKSVRELIVEKMHRLQKERTAVKLAPGELQRKLALLLNLPDSPAPLRYRMLRYGKSCEGIPFYRLGIDTEPGIMVTLCSLKGALPVGEKVELLVSEKGSYAALGSFKFENPAADIRSVDLRGFGESLSYGGFKALYSQDYHYSSLGHMLNESLIGRRVHDLLSVIEFLCDNGAREITLRSQGLGSIPVIFATVLCQRNVKAVIDFTVPTYQAHVLAPDGGFPQSFVPRGILALTDLDELIKLFPERFIIRR